MVVLFGPCMFVAPLLFLLIPVAIVLWPPVLILLGVTYLIVWPFALLGKQFGIRWIVAAHLVLRRWFVVLLTPWRYFDAPKRKEP